LEHETQEVHDMMNDWGNFGGWGMGLGFVFMLLFWGLVILGIAALIRWLLTQSPSGRNSRDKTPLEIVQERYARGEIDREEYEQKKRDLEQ
jgi:putative membrane protein